MRLPVSWTFRPLPYLFAFLALPAFLQSCDSGHHATTAPPENRYLGFFKITAPTAAENGILDLDSAYEIAWTKGDAATAPAVDIFLYQGDSLIARIAANQPTAAGSYKPLTFGKGLIGSGQRYRIKIAGSLPDTAQHDFGPYFSVSSRYKGAILFSSPKAGASVTFDSALSISWTHTGEVGSSLTAELHKGGTKVALIATDLPDSGSYTWPHASSPLGSGSDYAIKLTSYQDPSVSAFSPAFEIQSRFKGSLTVSSPKAGDIFVIAKTASVPIAWTLDGSPGTEFALYLYRDTAQVRFITNDAGVSPRTYSWSGFSGVESSPGYRIKIVSLNDPSIFAFSGAFTFQGLPGDAFEPDGSHLTAKPILTDTLQSRSLPPRDTDWVRIDTKPGKAYSAEIKSNVTADAIVTDSNGTPIGEPLRGNTFSVPIDPAYSGRYYVRLSCGDYSETEYTITLKEYETSQLRSPLNWISPDSASQWITGSRYNIKWDPDTARYGSMGSMLNLSLYRDSSLAQAILPAYNSGTVRWTPAEGLATSDRYRIRIGNPYKPLIYSYGPYFAIKGLAPDEYEPDDSRTKAKPMADGTVQRRILTYKDTDWVQIQTKPGQHTLVTVIGTVPVYVTAYDSEGKYVTGSGGAYQMVLRPGKAGTYYLCMGDTGSASAVIRNYSVFLQSYDSTRTDFPLQFGFDTSTHFSSPQQVTWTPDTAYYGARLILRLYRDDSEVRILDTDYPYRVPNSGAFSWAVPKGLFPSSRYRLRVESQDNPKVFAFSPYFHIDGMKADEFEPDDAMASAKSIPTDGSIQQRNFTYSDTDWIAFNGVAGTNYLISVNLLPTMNFNLVDPEGAKTNSKTGSMLYLAKETQTHFLQAQANTPGGAGGYSLFIYAGDTAQGFPTKFSAPDTNTLWAPGSTQNLVWIPDGALYGGTVTLIVYRGSKEALRINPANINNSGTYSWAIPSTLAPGTDYRIRMESYSGIKVFGYSRPFAIGAGP